jgi:hypothetical protein
MSSKPKGPKLSRGTAPSRPHNAKPTPYYGSLADIIEAVASEKQPITFRGRKIVMSRRERALRILIEKGLEGRPRELAQLLRLMAKYPDVAATFVSAIVIRGALCDV